MFYSLIFVFASAPKIHIGRVPVCFCQIQWLTWSFCSKEHWQILCCSLRLVATYNILNKIYIYIYIYIYIMWLECWVMDMELKSQCQRTKQRRNVHKSFPSVILLQFPVFLRLHKLSPLSECGDVCSLEETSCRSCFFMFSVALWVQRYIGGSVWRASGAENLSACSVSEGGGGGLLLDKSDRY